MRIIGGYQNTRNNDEDFAITPYLLLVKMFGKEISVIGLGICWGWCAVYIGLGFNLPKEIKSFYIHK